MNYRRLEKVMDKAFLDKEKAQPESVEGTMKSAFYHGLRKAVHEMGLWTDDCEGKHTIKSAPFVEIYKNDDGACNCEKCELSAKCAMKNSPLRVPDPYQQRIGLCPKWVR